MLPISDFDSLFCIEGADFIKTSTGKEGVNAILPVGLVMVRAIREYYERTGYKVGDAVPLHVTNIALCRGFTQLLSVNGVILH